MSLGSFSSFPIKRSSILIFASCLFSPAPNWSQEKYVFWQIFNALKYFRSVMKSEIGVIWDMAGGSLRFIPGHVPLSPILQTKKYISIFCSAWKAQTTGIFSSRIIYLSGQLVDILDNDHFVIRNFLKISIGKGSTPTSNMALARKDV